MASGELVSVIAGTREDWPGGARTLTPRESTREPNGTLGFRAELDPDGDQVWFRTDEDAVGPMPAETPADRGRRLVDVLIVLITSDPPARSPTSTASRSGVRGRRRVARTPGVAKMDPSRRADVDDAVDSDGGARHRPPREGEPGRAKTRDVRFVKGAASPAASGPCGPPLSPAPEDRVVPLSPKKEGLRFNAAARAAGVEYVDRPLRTGRARVGAGEPGASSTDVMLAAAWKISRMVAHYSAGATAERGCRAAVIWRRRFPSPEHRVLIVNGKIDRLDGTRRRPRIDDADRPHADRRSARGRAVAAGFGAKASGDNESILRKTPGKAVRQRLDTPLAEAIHARSPGAVHDVSGADSRAAPVGRAAAACFRRRRAPTVALATLLRDQPLSTREISFALGRGRLTSRPSAPAPGCSARPRSARRTPPADRARTATPPTASA